MLADWIPARTSLAAGIVIKNTLLDRNRYRTPQVSTEAVLANIGSGSTNIPYIVEDQTITGSIDVGNIEGGNGGSMPDLLGLTSSLFTYPGAVNITQVWEGSTPSLSGSVSFTESSQTEFYDGELSGSNLVVTTGVLNNCEAELLEVYSRGILGTPNGPSIPNVPIPYYVSNDKIYYLTFSYNGLVSGETLSVVDSSGEIYLSIVSSPSSDTIYQLKINNPTYPLGFNSDVPLQGSAVIITDLSLYEYGAEPDCLAVENDVQVSRPSSKYLDVDFTDNYITAVNEQAILSRSATKATVPDSNYTSLKNANPRYFGCQTISPTGSIYEGFVNQSMVSGSSIGALANVEQYCDWFAYFTSITYDEVFYVDGFQSNFASSSIVHITSLININGDVIDLSPTNNIPLSGSTTPNPLTSNVPLLESIFPYTFDGLSFNISSTPPPGISVEIRQYLTTSGSQSVISGSLSSYNVLTSGIQSLTSTNLIPPFSLGNYSVYGDYNETIVNLNLYYPNQKSPISTNSPGLLIPQNFNPKFKGSILKIAQEAGFLNNI
jgi:hypothetical protein